MEALMQQKPRPMALAVAAALLAAAAAADAQSPPSKVFNPDISVIGNFIGIAGHNDVEKRDALELHESEIGFSAIVDPYARADFFVTLSNDEVGIEEGYITFLDLPGQLLVKAGKLKGAFGKLNTEHLHVRMFPDAPLPMLNLLGTEDGIDDAGISVSKLIPAPKDVFVEATAPLFRGTSDGVFESHSRNDVEPLFHLRAYKDLTESANLDVGGSFTRGNGVGGPGLKTRLWGADATLRWKPLRQGLYKSLLVRGEWFLSERDTPLGRVRADGYYVHGQWQLARRWFVGARHDESDHADDSSLRDRGNSVVLTFWPSEFSQLRAQARRNRYEIAGRPAATATELFLQVQFVIGAHGAHPF
jgi:hypothetical protein